METPVVHFEIGCRDKERTAQFFTDLFGWKMSPLGPATFIESGGQGGIPGHITSLGHEPHHYVTVYVRVSDLQVSVDKAVGLGARLLVPPTPIPTGRFAWISDLDGNTIGLLEAKH